MKKKLYTITTILGMLLTTSLCSSQQFGTFKKIEGFMDMNPNELEKELNNEGYVYVSKEEMNTMTLKTYKKSNNDNFVVNYGFKGNKVLSFQWNDRSDRAIFIVSDIEKTQKYKYVESKTDDRMGIYYLESTVLNLNIIIYNTIIQKQKREIGFRIFRNEEKRVK